MALQLAQSDPRRAYGLALHVLEETSVPVELRCVALRAAALAALQLERPNEARRFVAEGIRLAGPAGLRRHAAELRATSALLWFQAEKPGRAFAELDEALAAEPEAPSEAVAALRGQRAYLCFRLGLYEEGLAESGAALAALDRLPIGAAATLRARVLSNRALAHLYRGDYPAALKDLRPAFELNSRAGADVLSAQVVHNMAFAATRLGEITLALSLYDDALSRYVGLGLPLHQLVADRAELFMTARLLPEARRAAAEAADAFERAGLTAESAEARLTLAEACLAERDLAGALRAASEAEAAFARQGREPWAVLAADMAERVARLAEPGGRPLDLAESAARSYRRLEAAGWLVAALSARVEAARFGLAAGRPDLVRAATAGPLLGGELRGTPRPPLESVLIWHAKALALAGAGRRRAALRALERALGLAGSHVAELRATTGQPGHAATVATIVESALGLVLEGGEAAEVLAWAERGRAAARGEPAALASPQLLSERLAAVPGCALVEFVQHGGELFAVAAGRGSPALSRLGSARPLEGAAAALHLAAGELARPGGSPATRRSMAGLLRRAAGRLDAALGGVLADLASEVAGPTSHLTVVPAGPLHAVPWGLLPSLHGLVVSAATSALGSGAGGGSGPPPRGNVLLVAGPGLKAAEAEALSLAACWEGRRPVSLLVGAAASRRAVLAALRSAEVVHLAVHGRFRADNPLLSTFSLADGELSLFDMAGVLPRPRAVVLSACDAGRVVSYHGEELAGPPPALLCFGAGSVVAPLAPLGDEAAAGVAEPLHRRLAAGQAAPVALALLQEGAGSPLLLEDDELAAGGERAAVALAASLLVCYAAASVLPGKTPGMLGESSS